MATRDVEHGQHNMTRVYTQIQIDVKMQPTLHTKCKEKPRYVKPKTSVIVTGFEPGPVH